MHERLCVVQVPMLNPDGVVRGNYRRDVNGVDLNRVWNRPKAEETPSIFHCRKLMESIVAAPGVELACFVDVHAHAATTSNFFIANSEFELERTFLWMEKRLKKYDFGATRFDAASNKEGCGRRAISEALPGVMACTLELSFFATASKSRRGCETVRATTIKGIRKKGKRRVPLALRGDTEYKNTSRWYMDIGNELCLALGELPYL